MYVSLREAIMIKAKELREMKQHPYGEDSVDLTIEMNLIMVDIIYAAKDGKEYYQIAGEEYYDRDTPNSCYVLDCLEELGYTIDKDVEWDAVGEPSFVTVISWR